MGVLFRMSSYLLLLSLLSSSVLYSQSAPQVLAWGAGAIQQIQDTLAAGVAANTQWFPATGSDCVKQAANATISPGWPSTQDRTRGNLNVCWRRRVLLHGGRWSSWRYIPGSTVESWRPDWLASTLNVVTVPDLVLAAEDAVEDAVLEAEDAMSGLVVVEGAGTGAGTTVWG